ncbi:EAL domain-containing protein [Methylomonas sp. LL1]|uniref:EAL domain-containing protein n=1 Tax=Methylomonas sp. LL1 TaxID=2785785 RepID=UPI0018C40989|nr:EAL domain-containing protein [Methylomonas sp. LL1]QPK64586.1 EAL domain-containing protein [Methylomonas sp. LL1]
MKANRSGNIRRWNLKRWRRGSLVVDSTIKIFLVGVGLALLFALASMRFIRMHETQRMMGHVDELLSTVESAVRVACFTSDVTLASDVASGLLNNRLIAAVNIKSGDRILAEHRRTGAMELENNVVHRAVSSPFGSDETVGEIELSVDNAFIQGQAVEYSIMSSVVLMLEVIASAWAVALVMMRRVVGPIRALSDRTHGICISSGEHVIPPEGNADNEIGQLAHDFNQIIDSMNSLLAAEQTMREDIALNERRFRTLVENTPDIIVRYDRDCRRVFVNRAYCRETGNPVIRVLNTSLDDAEVWLPDMPSREYRRRLQQVMDSGAPDLILLEWTRPDGRWVSHDMYVVAEYDAGGQVIGTLAIGRDVTERKAAERQLLHQASYDSLTALPNRRLFNQRLHEEIARAERHRQGLAVFFIDLDRFKEVNDTLGHGVGDQLLVEAARRIQACVRESDTVARLAGDEFVAIVAENGGIDTLERIAQSMVAGIGQPFHLGQFNAFVSASIGIAIYPQDAGDTETLIGCADQAMYFAKEDGRNNYRFFTGGMLEQAQQRLQLAGDLREALALGQFELHYQPIMTITGGQAVKAEALLRWRHPRLGMVPPDQFIAIAEETGLIETIGAWVFREAVLLAKRWNALAGPDHSRQISINMSPRQFAKGNGDRMAIDCLRACGLASSHIAIEITEGLLLDDGRDITGQLERLRNAGIEISLDDFGTGYSSMAYLKKFNIDYLKIDRSFVRDLETDPGDRAIAEAIVVMAHRLDLKVIAEGVETEAQQAVLAAVGCEYVQGYLYARPMPAEQFMAFVSQSPFTDNRLTRQRADGLEGEWLCQE